MPAVREMPIRRCRPSEDVVPFSECRNNLSMYITRVRETHRPVLITQNGRAANVFLDVGDYQKLIDKLDLMMDIYKGEQNIAAGRVHSTDEVRRAIAADLGVSGRRKTSATS